MFDAAQHLIEQIRHSLVIEIHLNDLTQVRVHELHDEIDILEFFQCALGCERV